ncbi:unnamed protein product [Mytilus edulis]|uniref:Uncharacterized protein n=1 Tax=Mytilus edulis TaxID=6550 RepID=A0A8S3Q8W3_MYTED|nr:unnamed protein product [Mytilus edulis]
MHVVDTPVNENGKVEDAVVTNTEIPFVTPEIPTPSESEGANTKKPVEKTNKDVLSSGNIKNNIEEETNLKEAPPTGISLNKEPDYKSDDDEIEKPGYLFSKGVPGEEAQAEDLGFTNKITGIKDPLPTDQSSSSRETVQTEKAKDEDKKLTIVDGNVLTKTASGNVSEPTVENKSNQSNEHKDDSTEKPSDKLQPEILRLTVYSQEIFRLTVYSQEILRLTVLQPGNTPSDKLQSGNTPSDKLQPENTPSDKLQPGNMSDNQQNKNDSTGYNHSKFSNPCDEQDKKMSKEMKEIDDPPPNAIIQNYYGYVETVNLGNDIVNIVEKVKEVEKDEFQQTSIISALKMEILLAVSKSVGIFMDPRQMEHVGE